MTDRDPTVNERTVLSALALAAPLYDTWEAPGNGGPGRFVLSSAHTAQAALATERDPWAFALTPGQLSVRCGVPADVVAAILRSAVEAGMVTACGQGRYGVAERAQKARLLAWIEPRVVEGALVAALNQLAQALPMTRVGFSAAETSAFALYGVAGTPDLETASAVLERLADAGRIGRLDGRYVPAGWQPREVRVLTCEAK